MFLCELVTFQNGMKISGAKTDPAETQRTNETLKLDYILIFKSVECCSFILISYKNFCERPDNICFTFIFTGNIWWRELWMFHRVQKCKLIWNMTFNEPYLSKQTKNKWDAWKALLQLGIYFVFRIAFSEYLISFLTDIQSLYFLPAWKWHWVLCKFGPSLWIN